MKTLFVTNHSQQCIECMTALGALPNDTVNVEDSHIGRQGALDSKCHLVPVEDRDLNQSKVDRIKKILNGTKKSGVESKTMNVLIPMAGRGSRFAFRVTPSPKPLIEVKGKPMIQVVTENLNIKANYTFIVQKEHYEQYNLNYLLPLIAPGCNIVQVDGITEGACCTTLLAKEFINNDEPLVMANLTSLLSGILMRLSMPSKMVMLMVALLPSLRLILSGLMPNLRGWIRC